MIRWKPGKVHLAEQSLKTAVKNKKIGLMVNGSAIHNDGTPLIDLMHREKWCDIEFVLGMEHGVRCNYSAGEKDEESIDSATGIKIVNLYDYPGRRPPVEELRRIDAVVYCAQDAGVRHWTFTPWLFYLIDSAAEAGCEVIVVDRPNPIGGNLIEGNLVEGKYLDTLLTGFGYPLRHGMTVGELALMYKSERHPHLDLTVLPMDGWERNMFYSDTGLIWIPPTPNTPTPETFLDFATSGLLQSSDLSLGDHTQIPFKFVGRPEICAEELARELNSRGLDDVFFYPRTYISSTRWEKDVMLSCNGVITVYRDKKSYLPVTAQLHLIDALAKLYHDKIQFEYKPFWARTRMGTDAIYDRIERGESVLDLVELWREHSEEFARRRSPYLLYK